MEQSSGAARAARREKATNRDEEKDLRHYNEAKLGIASISLLSGETTNLGTSDTCHFCGGTLKVVEEMEYEYEYECNPTTFVTVKKILPGYSCATCDAEYVNNDLDRQFLKGIARVVVGLSDDEDLAHTIGLRGNTRQSSPAETPWPLATSKKS